MPSRDDWNDHWSHYASAAERNPAQRMRHALILRLLSAGGAAAPRVLDIGSGQGDLLARLRDRLPHAELAGVELSAHGVNISRRKVPAGRFVVADLLQPPSPEMESLRGWATDAVCSEVLEHVDDPVGLLRAARPYLAPGARLIVTVPGGPVSAFDRHIGHRHHFTRESLRQILEQSGFAVEGLRRGGFPFFNLYRLVVIARGRRLVADVSEERKGAWSGVADAVMAGFRLLLPLGLPDFPLGWQIIGVARKSGTE